MCAQDEYVDVLSNQIHSCVSAADWLKRWRKTYTKAMVAGIHNIEGSYGTRQFLKAVWHFNPILATNLIINTHKPEDKSERAFISLYDCSMMFEQVIYDNENWGRQDVPCPLSTTASERTEVESQPAKEKNRKCPCNIKKHHWEPIGCRLLHEAITGVTEKGKRPVSTEYALAIRNNLRKPKFDNLRTRLEDLGIFVPSDG